MQVAWRLAGHVCVRQPLPACLFASRQGSSFAHGCSGRVDLRRSTSLHNSCVELKRAAACTASALVCSLTVASLFLAPLLPAVADCQNAVLTLSDRLGVAQVGPACSIWAPHTASLLPSEAHLQCHSGMPNTMCQPLHHPLQPAPAAWLHAAATGMQWACSHATVNLTPPPCPPRPTGHLLPLRRRVLLQLQGGGAPPGGLRDCAPVDGALGWLAVFINILVQETDFATLCGCSCLARLWMVRWAGRLWMVRWAGWLCLSCAPVHDGLAGWRCSPCMHVQRSACSVRPSSFARQACMPPALRAQVASMRHLLQWRASPRTSVSLRLFLLRSRTARRART